MLNHLSPSQKIGTRVSLLAIKHQSNQSAPTRISGKVTKAHQRHCALNVVSILLLPCPITFPTRTLAANPFFRLRFWLYIACNQSLYSNATKNGKDPYFCYELCRHPWKIGDKVYERAWAEKQNRTVLRTPALPALQGEKESAEFHYWQRHILQNNG